MYSVHSNVQWISCIVLILQFLCFDQNNGLDGGSDNTVLALKGKSALLKCQQTIGIGSAPVMWLHPHIGAAISVNSRVMIPQFATRMSIVGDNTRGEYHLLIKYVKYPDDVGAWKCVSLGMKQTRNLTVLTPPVEMVPAVSPEMVNDIKHEAWTFTCAAQFSIPPVNLTWVKVTGPDANYDVTLPSYVVSSQHSVAVSLRLIVTPLNYGSVFKCVASHPSFGGQLMENKVFYSPPRTLLQKAAGTSPSIQSPPDLSAQVMMDKVTPTLALGLHEKASIVFLVMLSLTVLLVAFVLCRRRRKWQWNDISLKGIVSQRRLAKCKFCTKAIIWTTSSILLITCLGLSFTVYMKGITIPLLGTDMLMSVSAGSALWMDCGSKIQPINSLLQISWQYNFQPFYLQYMVNGKNIGFPHNSTMGFMKGIRTKSYRIGQISIWPILPGEDGIYSCVVAGIEDSSGRTRIKRKTFGVFVVTGPYLNKPLLALLGVALASAVTAFITVSCHIVVRKGQANKNVSFSEDTSKETSTDENVERNDVTNSRASERPLMVGNVG